MELVGIARNPVPNGAVPGSFVTRDGLTIRYALWPRTADRRLGTVCLFSGRGEFIEKYFETITDLRRRGFAVAMMDWRGQGGSDRLLKNPRKCHVEDFTDFDKDLGQFMSEIVLPDCPAPFYGMAHSMGGNILLRSALTKVCWFDRIMLSAPMIDIRPEFTQSTALRYAIEAQVLFGLGDRYVPGGKPQPLELAAVRGQQADQRSLALRPGSRRAESRALAELRLADPGMASGRSALDHADQRLRLCLLDQGARADRRGRQRHRRLHPRHRAFRDPGEDLPASGHRRRQA